MYQIYGTFWRSPQMNIEQLSKNRLNIAPARLYEDNCFFAFWLSVPLAIERYYANAVAFISFFFIFEFRMYGFCHLTLSFTGHVEIVKFLIEHGADVNAKPDDGITVLYWAAKYGKYPNFQKKNSLLTIYLLQIRQCGTCGISHRTRRKHQY